MTVWEPRLLPWVLALVLAGIAVGLIRTHLRPDPQPTRLIKKQQDL